MCKYFFLKKKQIEKEENNINSLLLTKLERIIELLEQKNLEQNRNEGKNLHFDHVQIDHIENMIYRLDNIEIDQLSGKLIIGNHIMASEDLTKTLVQKIDKENAKKETMSKTTSDDGQFEKTNKGYRFRNQF